MRTDTILTVVSIIYLAWGVYAGWKFMNGRFAFLEKDNVGIKILKIAISCVVGWAIAGFYLMYLICRATGIIKKK